MTFSPAAAAPMKPLRLWPGVALVVVQWFAWVVVPRIEPEASAYSVLTAVFCGILVALWWTFFSRAPWSERIAVLILAPLAVVVTKAIVHASVANAMMGMMVPLFSFPVLSLALVLWAVATRNVTGAPRRVTLVAAVLLACGTLLLVRTGGISGGGSSDLHWRWSETAEEKLLAAGNELANLPRISVSPTPEVKTSEIPAPSSTDPKGIHARGTEQKEPTPSSGAPVATTASDERVPATGAQRDWPGFRGPERNGVLHGVNIKTDWATSPPVQLWRRPVGPGWSSFAVSGDRFFTQEQRGEDEIVSCYSLSTGKPLWSHRDAARFWESNGGAGPRGTPMLADGRIYTLGATGIVNALNASDGSVVWSRNAAADTGATQPGWGFAGSPLVVDDMVVVAASGRLVAYDLGTGEPRWFGPKVGGGGYSSPHLIRIGDVAQILLLRGGGVVSVAPKDGAVLWEHPWQSGVSIVQPALTEDGDVLIAGGDSMGGIGIRRLKVAPGPSGWTVEERWTSRGLKPYFNDFVVHKGHAIGFDGSILSNIDLANGQRTWKGGRYGSGQLMLLADQDLLLVSSEEGGLALVSASADQFTEIARFPAIDGKTWNHPALAGDVLLVRNAEEMIAFRLPLANVPTKIAGR